MRTASLELSRTQDERHRDKRQKKQERIDILKALLDMHESNRDCDYDYVLGLRARLRNAQNQLNAMGI